MIVVPSLSKPNCTSRRSLRALRTEERACKGTSKAKKPPLPAPQIRIIVEALCFFYLLFDNIICKTSDPRIEHIEMLLKDPLFGFRNNDRPNLHMRNSKLHDIHSPKCGMKLVLRSDIFSNDLLLHMTRFLSKPLLRYFLSSHGI